MNKGARFWIRVLTGAVILGMLETFLWLRELNPTRQPGPDAIHPGTPQLAHRPETQLPPNGLIGERILGHYADPARRPEDDLTDLAHALGNFALLVKGDNPLPLGANEDIANALRGKNRAQLRFLPDDHRAFNAQGQLVDRWGTALFFHATSSDRLDIRSAGPDKIMWTADDLHRSADGRFLQRDALLAPSLFDPARKKDRSAR